MESYSPQGQKREYVSAILKKEAHEAVLMLHTSNCDHAVKQLNYVISISM